MVGLRASLVLKVRVDGKDEMAVCGLTAYLGTTTLHSTLLATLLLDLLSA